MLRQKLVEASGEMAAQHAIKASLEQINNEDIYKFNSKIHGSKDIYAQPAVSTNTKNFLVSEWQNRCFFEYSPNEFYPTWTYRDSKSWNSLSHDEQARIKTMIEDTRTKSEEIWEKQGQELLTILKNASTMLPCAEDLGAVPDCVPRVLETLGILGLKVLRWARHWAEGKDYIDIDKYPRLSIACATVHDSSSLRAWWSQEAEKELSYSFLCKKLNLNFTNIPESLAGNDILNFNKLIAKSNSQIAIYPIQDLIAMSESKRPLDPVQERINTPGTVGEENWSYILAYLPEELFEDAELSNLVLDLVRSR